MKRITLTLLAFAGLTSVGLYAQGDNDTLKINMNGTEIIISTDDLTSLQDINLDGMLRDFSVGMREAAETFSATMNEIKAMEEAGEITAEEADQRREEATEKFELRTEKLGELMESWGEAQEDNMEEWAESQEEEWDRWAERWEENAEEMDGSGTPRTDGLPEVSEEGLRGRQFIIDEDGIRIEDRIEEIIISPDNDGYIQDMGVIGFHFGWNTLMNDDYQVSSGESEVRFFQSWAYDLEIGHKIRIGRKTPLIFHYGLNFSWHNIETKESLVKFEDPATGDPVVAFQSRPGLDVNETEFDIVYMDIPLMLHLDLSGKDMDDSFTLGVGGYGGVRLSSERESKYVDFNRDIVEENIDDHFLSNQWRYGLMGQVGLGSFKLTARYDLNQLFQENYDTPNYHIASLTLGFVF